MGLVVGPIIPCRISLFAALGICRRAVILRFRGSDYFSSFGFFSIISLRSALALAIWSGVSLAEILSLVPLKKVLFRLLVTARLSHT